MKIDTSDMVTIHPYFSANPGKMPQIKTLLPEFVARTATEPGNLFYDFCINGDEIFCREGYRGGEAAVAHLHNVEALLGKMMEMARLSRLEIHGPTAELEKLKPALAKLNPAWFARQV